MRNLCYILLFSLSISNLKAQKNIYFNKFNGLKDNSCYRIKCFDQQIYFGSDAGFFKISNEEVQYLDINQKFNNTYTIDLTQLGGDTAIYTVWHDGTYFCKGNKIIKKFPRYGNEIIQTPTLIVLKTQNQILIFNRKDFNLLKVFTLKKNKSLISLDEVHYNEDFQPLKTLPHFDYSLSYDSTNNELHFYNLNGYKQYIILNLNSFNILKHPLSQRNFNAVYFEKNHCYLAKGNVILKFNRKMQLVKSFKIPLPQNTHIQTFIVQGNQMIIGSSPHERSLTFDKIHIFNPKTNLLHDHVLENKAIQFRHMYLYQNQHLFLSSVDDGVHIIKHVFILHKHLNYELKDAKSIITFKNEVYFTNQHIFGKINEDNFSVEQINNSSYANLIIKNDSILAPFHLGRQEDLKLFDQCPSVENKVFFNHNSNQNENYQVDLKPFCFKKWDTNTASYIKLKGGNQNLIYKYYTHLDSVSYLQNKEQLLLIDWRDNANFRELNAPDSYEFNHLHQEKGGIILSTNKGLLQLNQFNKFTPYPIHPFIDSSNIQKSFCLDSNTRVIFTTQEMFLQHGSIQHFYNLKNLNIHEVPMVALLKNNFIELYGTFGLRLIPLQQEAKQQLPPFTVSDLQMEYDYNTPFRFEIYPSSPIIDNPSVYRYKLQKDQAWNYTTQDQMKLELIAQDNYDIQVDHFGPSKVWTPILLKHIKTDIPWYLNIYVIILISLIVLSFGAYYAYHQIQKIRGSMKLLEKTLTEKSQLNKKLENIRMQLASDFHDNLGNDLASIIVNTEVLQDPNISKEKHLELNRRINKNAQNIYNGAKDFIWTLQLNHNNTTEIFQLINDFGNEFFELTPFNFSSENAIQKALFIKQEDVQDLILIIKELITNAYKHSDGSLVSFNMSHLDQHIIFSVVDNGKGLTSASQNQSNGLNNIELRSKKINATFKYLRTQNKTRFILSYPYEN